jgi:hypothetical protein
VLFSISRRRNGSAAVAGHPVKIQPEKDAWWITLAYSVRRIEGEEKAEAILLRGQAIHPKNALIAFSLACYAIVISAYL